MNNINSENQISALIVAGGRGSRLGKLCDQTQKCMLELWGKPLLFYLIASLRNVGCKNIIIAVDYLGEQVKNYFKDGRDMGVEINYVEGNFISTYDALFKSLELLSSRFLYLHANILFQNSLLEKIISLGKQNSNNIIAVIPGNNNTLKHAQVSIDKNDFILEIDLKERNNRFPYTFLGVAYYHKQDFIALFNGDSSGMVEKLIEQLLEVETKTLVCQYSGEWRHIETENDYFTVKLEKQFGTYQVTPSLVLNITDLCNMHCRYCPPYGENLSPGEPFINISIAKTLIHLAKQNHFKTVRLTGGEPLLYPLQLQVILDECGESFERVVLNSNGACLHNCFDMLEKFKNNIVLKISFDSLNITEYEYLTKSEEFNKVLNNINTAIFLGFKVEINTVIINQSPENIKQLIAYFTGKQVPVKLLTFSNYYGKVKTECSFDLDSLIDYLATTSVKNSKEHLKGGRGVLMLKYTINNTTVFLIDHSTKSSKTPLKSYFYDCEESCTKFPCDCGALSISLSTDCILSPCRGRKDFGLNAIDRSDAEIEKAFNTFLEKFENCVEININYCNNN